jgi:hypothetical protein
MTKLESPTLDELLPGMRAAFFEVVWPAFPWIRSVWVKESRGQLQLFVETAATQDEKEWDDFDYMVRRVLKAGERALDGLEVDSKHRIEQTIQHGSIVPKDRGYRELMSDRLFKKIAKRHAPWRLESGR